MAPPDRGSPERPRRIPRQETRARIVEAAAQVFARRGYEAATLDEVAAHAGYSKGAVYSNFANKEELFLTLMRERIQQRLEAVGEATAQPGTLDEQTARAGAQLTELLEQQPDWHRLFIEFWGRAVRDEALRLELVEQRRPMRATIAAFLEDLSTRYGVALPAAADDLAVIILALSNGIAIEHLADPETVDPKLYATALNLLLGAVASGEPPHAS